MLRQDRRAGAVDATLLWTGATASVLLLGTLIAGIMQFAQIRRSLQTQAAIARATFAEHDKLLQMVNQETGVRGYVATGDEQYLSIYFAARPAWQRDRQAAKDIPALVPAVAPRMRESNAAATQLQRYFDDEIDLMRSGQTQRAKQRLIEGKVHFDRLRALDGAIHAQIDGVLETQRTRTRTLVQAALAAAAGLCAVVLLWIAAFVFLLRRALRYRRRSVRDPLTGAYNRGGAIQAIEAQIRAARGNEFGMIFLDLDGFKKINDAYGHAAGDSILQTVAQRLANELRPNDTISRLGGDEFLCVIAAPADLDQVRLVAQRVRKALAQPYEHEGDMYAVGCSFGISMYPAHGTSAQALLACADTAMYDAKHHGGGVSEAGSRAHP
jgi:diguanylate cyclase (GGDEF)-like protein